MSEPIHARQPMAPDRWRQVQDLLADAIDCPVATRRALLDERCGDDASLRQEVESLLTAHDAGGLLDQLAAAVGPLNAWTPEPASDWSGRRTTHYLVQEALGVGGMGVVYRARDERLGRQVALKFLPPHLSASPEAKARFVAEARAAAALEHPGVCTIYEIGETGDGQLFIAMPLYEGETLQARLRRGRLAFGEALPVALQVARALGHAHGSGIVHRDVKPSNIVLLPDGTVKVLDFGIAQIQDQPATGPQTVLGTIAYMSPEQASGGPVDHRSDIWSLGIVVHEMLAGVRPFHSEGGRATLQAILTQAPNLTASSYPDVPVGIDRVLRRALARAPDQRYASMSGLAADLAALTPVHDAGETPHAFGQPDAPSGASTGERRRAAMLVTVVSDYASLVDQMTPHEAHRLVMLLRDAAVDVVRSYGGLVNQAMGEEIVSVFGVPVAHDDDDLRAVRAALDLHARVSAFECPDCPSGVTLRIQSGLHVGPVVARRLHEGPRRYDIAGPPVRLATRLAAFAEAGTVWVSPETHRQIAPYVHTAACAPVVLDSKAGPVTPFSVLGETGIVTRLEVSSRTGLTPYVGRDAELSTLRSQVARATSGQGAVIALVGEAGAGKSRLLHELRGCLATAGDVRVLQARCHAYGDGVPYGAFVQVLCAALELRSPLGNADLIVTRIRAQGPPLEPFIPLLLHLLSASTARYALPRHLHGEHLQAALLDSLAALLGALARRAPLVVIIDDWQWADTGSRAALRRVAELAGSSRLVLIVTTRMEDEGVDEWPPHTTRLRLEPLHLSASVTIVEALLGAHRASEALSRRLHERAGGNPFFLEQLCAALLERHALAGSEVLIDDGEDARSLPDTVEGVIRARLDNLDGRAREIVRVAAVIGPEFDHALLAEVVPPHADLESAIAALHAAGLVQPTSSGSTIRYRFTHALTQEVCYGSLVGHQRKMLHGAIGRALASAQPSRSEEEPARLAHHFGRAEDWPAAIRFGRRAAERAITVGQFADALGTLDQVLEWVSHLPDGRRDGLMSDLLLQQERLCETLGLRARQRAIIDSLIARLAGDGGSARLAEAYLRQGDLATLLKRFDAADRALGTALRIAQERADTTLTRAALRSLGLLRWHEGRHSEALDATRRALALDRECEDDVAVAVSLTNLGNILRASGDLAGARARLEEALAMPALRADPKKLVYTRHNLANLYRAVGDVDRALACLLENDEIARVHLLPIQRSFHLTSLAHIQLQQGHIDTAIDTYRTAVDLSRRARHADGLAQSLRMLGNVLLGLGRYEEALPCLQEAAQSFAQLEDRLSEAEMWTGIARILDRQSPGEAVRAWNVVLTLQLALGDTRAELDARVGLARALRAQGAEGASAAFAAALTLATAIGDRTRELALLNTLGIFEWEDGRYDEALTHYNAALALIRDEGDSEQQALLLNSVGVTLTKLGRPEEARTVLEQSLAVSRRAGEQQLEAHALTALGHVAAYVHDLGAAAAYFERSRVLRRVSGDRTGEGWMHLRLSELRKRMGDRAGAIDAARAAAAAAVGTGDETLSAASAEAARAALQQ